MPGRGVGAFQFRDRAEEAGTLRPVQGLGGEPPRVVQRPASGSRSASPPAVSETMKARRSCSARARATSPASAMRRIDRESVEWSSAYWNPWAFLKALGGESF